jgi:hypothetical protein
MSLMQLLAVGRSIGTIKDEPSRYKVVQENLLPRFGPVNRAEEHGSESEPEAPLSGAATQSNAQQELDGLGQQRTEAAPEPKTSERAGLKPGPLAIQREARPMPILEQSQNEADRVSGLKHRIVASPWRGWSLLGNPFKTRSRGGKGRRPVQTELGLEMIQPVRNDLSETDLEIRPSSRKAGTEEKLSPLAEAAKPARWREWLTRLRSVLLKPRSKQT